MDEVKRFTSTFWTILLHVPIGLYIVGTFVHESVHLLQSHYILGTQWSGLYVQTGPSVWSTGNIAQAGPYEDVGGWGAHKVAEAADYAAAIIYVGAATVRCAYRWMIGATNISSRDTLAVAA